VWWKLCSNGFYLVPVVLAGINVKNFNPYLSGLLILFLTGGLIRVLRDRKRILENLRLEKMKSETSQERESLLERAIVSRDNLVSLAAHEIRTPLTALKLQLDLMMRKINDSDRSSMEQMIKQVDKLVGIVSCYLDATRVSKDQLQLNINQCNIATLIRSVFQRYTAFMNQNKLSSQVTGPSNLFIDCDPDRIEQVIVNLISNSAKHAPGSLIEVEVSLSDQNVTINYSDQKTERKTEGLEKSQEGLGIGLFITRQIIEAHSGIFKSEFKNGRMTHQITLPLHFAQDREGTTSIIPKSEDLFFIKSFLCDE
jgi:signal transduction histidine kinase